MGADQSSIGACRSVATSRYVVNCTGLQTHALLIDSSLAERAKGRVEEFGSPDSFILASLAARSEGWHGLPRFRSYCWMSRIESCNVLAPVLEGSQSALEAGYGLGTLFQCHGGRVARCTAL